MSSTMLFILVFIIFFILTGVFVNNFEHPIDFVLTMVFGLCIALFVGHFYIGLTKQIEEHPSEAILVDFNLKEKIYLKNCNIDIKKILQDDIESIEISFQTIDNQEILVKLKNDWYEINYIEGEPYVEIYNTKAQHEYSFLYMQEDILYYDFYLNKEE